MAIKVMYKIFVTKIILLLCILNTHAQTLSEGQKIQLESKVNKLLDDYQYYSTLSETNRYVLEEYLVELEQLFYNDQAKIFNDLNKPGYNEELVILQEYMWEASDWFSEGVTVTITRRIAGEPVYIEENRFMVKVDFTKSLEGYTSNYAVLKNTSYELSTAILFDADLKELKMLGVWPYKDSLEPFIKEYKALRSIKILEPLAENRWQKEEEATEERASEDKSTNKVKAPTVNDFQKPEIEKEDRVEVPSVYNYITAEGLFVGVNLGLHPLDNLQISWANLKEQSGLAIDNVITEDNFTVGGVEVSYFFNPNLGISIELGYEVYNMSIQLDSMLFSQSVTDIDNDPSTILILWRDFEEQGRFPFLNTGVNLHYKKAISNDIGFYAIMGATYGFWSLNPYIATDGNAEKIYRYAYDDAFYGTGIDELYAVEPLSPLEASYLDKYNIYDTGIRPLTDKDFTLNSPLIAKARFGILYALNSNLSFRLGGKLNWGLNTLLSGDIVAPKDWVEVIGSDANVDVENQYKSLLQQSDYLRFRGVGLEVGFVWKM